MASGTTRYRKAHTAGATGAAMPEGLASMADKDPNIDAAHDAGRNGVPFDAFAAEHLTTPKSAPSSSTDSPSPSPSPRRSLPSPGRPSLRRPLGANVALGSGRGTGLAGVFLGAIVYAVVLSVVDYGAKGPGMWFRAKFMNKAGAANSPQTPSTPPNVPGHGYIAPTPTSPGAPAVSPGTGPTPSRA
jgi:hypothetical protein